MKKSALHFIGLFVIVFTVASCTKDKFNAPAGQIAASKIVVKINEPDSLALVGADSTKAVNWSISPSGFDSIYTYRNLARVVFTKSGNYTVSASQGSATPATITIKVTDSVYVPTPPYTKFTAGDQITVVPKYVKSSISDSTYLAFSATTKDAYCTNSTMDFAGFYDRNAGAYYIQFTQVLHNHDCGIGSTPLTAHLNFASYQPSLANGTYPLYIEFNNQPNQVGSIGITSTNITFNWDNSMGVVIAPMVLTR